MASTQPVSDGGMIEAWGAVTRGVEFQYFRETLSRIEERER